ncbi:hypothetical protein SSP35_03_03320 [Streptomyces sp. NBRC 110611]|uniref:hypothetical protein n=1 Tax=Streptomyces sp. NBRC 110611 TaxID=1621259 RepID=UPI00082FD11A|nr:hypothetical protein [Streptomyces sp. NBRC 110611]GAU66684.1 hypothetical protein SSP35_03_03320 [Streptomyces sp. NBRC 110611]
MTLVRTETQKGHAYTLDGEPAPGVTTLISGGLPKPALVGWAAKSAARYAVDHWRALAPLVASGEADAAYDEIRRAPFRERNAAAARGTEVHRYADALSRDEDTEVPEELYGYVAACAGFLDDWGVRPLLREAPVGSRAHGYAGTLDLVAELPGGQVALFDYKTSRSGVWPDTALQLAAYRYADFHLNDDGTESPMARLNITATYAVHLREDGYAVVPLDTSEETFQLFLDVAAVARADKARRTLVHAPVTPAHLLKTMETSR